MLEAASNRGAHLLRHLGIVRGDRIAICSDNRPEYLEICWAAERAGAVFVPVSGRLAADEAAHIIRDCDAKLLVMSPATRPAAEGLAAVLRRDALAILTLGNASRQLRRWDKEAAALSPTPIPDESAGRPMLYTSGTTGQPKGIVHADRPHDITAEHHYETWLRESFAMDSRSIFISPAPLYHAAPLVFSLTTHRLGGTVVLAERFDPTAFLTTVERYRITHAQLVPTMFIRLLRLSDEILSQFDLSSLQAVIHSGAPCPIAVKRAMIAWLGPIVHEYYGGSEGFGRTCISSAEWLDRPGSVGRARDGTIHICDAEGRELPPGKPGTVYFESKVAFAYHKAPQKTAAAAHPNHPGWRTFGDIGHLDKDGYLTLTDRLAFMIISGGVNIYPQEVENLLCGHPAIADVAVIGVPDPDMGEQVKAVVQTLHGVTAGPALEAELIDWCRARLAHYKCPRSVDFVDELPRNDTGKLHKQQLRDGYLPT